MIGKKDRQIAFYYSVEDLFNEVSQASAYMTKSVAVESGPALDMFAITDDERELFDVCIKKAVATIYESLLGLAPRNTESFNCCVDIKEDESTGLKRPVGKYVELAINDNRSYNTNALSLVNESIYDCLIYGTLSELYSINVSEPMRNICQDKFANNMLLLNQRLFQLKKKQMMSLL